MRGLQKTDALSPSPLWLSVCHSWRSLNVQSVFPLLQRLENGRLIKPSLRVMDLLVLCLQVISLGDIIKFSVSPSNSKDSLTTNAFGVPLDDKNLVRPKK